MRDPYGELANAIVVQAANDWRKAVKKLEEDPYSKPAGAMRKECERFFLSRWFTMLTSVDGKMILRKLKEEASYDG